MSDTMLLYQMIFVERIQLALGVSIVQKENRNLRKLI